MSSKNGSKRGSRPVPFPRMTARPGSFRRYEPPMRGLRPPKECGIPGFSPARRSSSILGRALFKGARIEACQRVLNPGEYFMMFSDWRQLPLMSDAVRAGGVVWRGVVAWVRTPNQASFKRQ